MRYAVIILVRYRGGRRPVMKKITAKIRPTTNKIQAIFTAVPAIPENPKTPAISAIIKNVTAQPIICVLLFNVNNVF